MNVPLYLLYDELGISDSCRRGGNKEGKCQNEEGKEDEGGGGGGEGRKWRHFQCRGVFSVV